METVTVRRAVDSEVRACLSVVPQAEGLEVVWLAARRDGAFAGAAAINWTSWRKPAGFPVLIHVVPGARRHGVGRALIAAAADLAAEETDGLWCATTAAIGGEAEAFMLACGFARGVREHHFEAELETLRRHLTPLREALGARGRGAATPIAPLREADLEATAWLVSESLGGGPFSALARLRSGRLGGGGDRSLAAAAEGEIHGLIVWRVEDGVAVVDGRVVAPRWRGGTLNLRLIEAVIVQAQAEGLSRVRFHCDESVRDTLRLARRAAAVETATNAQFYYAFAGA